MKYLIFSLFVLFAADANAQAFLERIGRSAKNAAENAVERNVDRKVEKTVDEAFEEETYKKEQQQSEKNVEKIKDDQTSGWKCQTCGTVGNTGKFCASCGAAQPTEKVTWECFTCGHKGNTGKFCAECGAAPNARSTTENVAPSAPIQKVETVAKPRKTFTTEEDKINASNPFFAFREGQELLYADYDMKGKISDYVRQKTTKLTKKDDYNFTVTYVSEILDKDKKSLMEPIEITVQVIDGDIYFDPSSGMGQMMKDAKIEGTGLTIPSDLTVGQQLAGYTVSIPALATTSTASDIRVSVREDITTEAGIFDAYKVEMTVNAKAMFIKTEGKTATWYARGIGIVKTENYDKKGKLLSSSVLIERK